MKSRAVEAWKRLVTAKSFANTDYNSDKLRQAVTANFTLSTFMEDCGGPCACVIALSTGPVDVHSPSIADQVIGIDR